MRERGTGPWALLKQASLYTWLQNIIGGPALRRYIIEQYIRPRPGDRLLDVGCGPADFAPLLPDVEYTGVDHNASYIASAQARHDRENARFIAADVAADGLGFAGAFDIVLAIGLLHHLDDAQVAALFVTIRRCLKPGGRVISIDPVWTTPQHWLAQLIIRSDRGQHVRTAEGYENLANAVFPRVIPELRTDLLRLPYTHLIMQCSADEVLPR